MMSIVIDAFRETLDEAVRAEPWGEGELLITPWEFSDHEPIVLYVRSIHNGFLVTDRGQATDNLGVVGVDFAKPSTLRSWAAVQQSIESPPFVQYHRSHWELAATASRKDLGLALHQVAEAALRADGLRALAGVRTQTPRFDAWVIKEAGDRGLSVVPHAEIRSTVGVKRKVSALIEGRHRAYVQAIGPSREPWDAYDRARSIFSDTTLDRSERFTVLSKNALMSAEQVEGIAQHSQVVAESEFANLLESVA